MADELNQKIFEENFEALMNQFQELLKTNSAHGFIAIKTSGQPVKVMTGQNIYETAKVACSAKEMIIDALVRSVHSAE